ncbi:MAG: chemotaxis protein CheR [Alphaproteobacteria bacterium]
MNNSDFQLVCDLVKKRSGIVLSADKAYLVESRLMPVCRKYRMGTLDDLAKKLRMGADEALLSDITEAMTTNESSFFRDSRPFDLLRSEVLPKMIEARQAVRRIRIWSAACSSGQEAYSAAMVLDEFAHKLAGWKIDIVGTDLSAEMVQKARDGVYTQFEVQRGLPVTHLVKYFDQVGDKWQIKPDMRSRVNFRTFNLLENMSSLGQFDIVFCRNVLIYFDQKTKATVLEGISRQIPADGVLYLGGAETVLGITDRFKPVEGQRGLYAQNGPTEQGIRAVG